MTGTFKLETPEEKKDHLMSLINIPSISARPYDPEEEYFRLDFIEHPEFGLGLVEEVLSSKKINVFFLEGNKDLDHRRL